MHQMLRVVFAAFVAVIFLNLAGAAAAQSAGCRRR